MQLRAAVIEEDGKAIRVFVCVLKQFMMMMRCSVNCA